MTRPISSDQIRALQAARRRAGISDDDWRAKLRHVGGVDSTKALSSAEAGRLLDELRGSGSPVDRRLTGPYAAKARALWISGYFLGVIADRRDEALLAWVQRQTGYRTLSWVREPRDGTRVIEALKDWLSRDGGVDWREGSDPKAAVLLALFERLAAAGAWSWQTGSGYGRISQIEHWASSRGVGPDRDAIIQAAGRRLRQALEQEG